MKGAERWQVAEDKFHRGGVETVILSHRVDVALEGKVCVLVGKIGEF